MGSSFTEYKGYGFWSSDWLLESWLRLLALNLPHNTEEDNVYKPGWLHDLREEWLLKSAGFFGGWISAQLDKHLSDDHRRTVILAVAQSTLDKIEACGDPIPKAFFYAIGIAFLPYDGPIGLEDMRSIATRFIDLLEGRLKTTAATSPTLPAPWIMPSATP